MAGERRYTRIPPESTGDRILMKHTVEIPYDGKNPSYNWVIGDNYTITGGGGSTFKIDIHSVRETTTTSGFLQVHYEDSAMFDNLGAINDQNINDDDGTTRAQVNGTPVDIYVNANHIVGYNNPDYGLEIDRFGAANITFAEGSPELSSHNNLLIGQQRLLAQYDFSLGRLADEFSNILLGTGSVTWNGTGKFVDIQTSTDSAGLASNTSNIYHPYTFGTGTSAYMTARSEDSAGKTNVNRLWGMFDSKNGALFKQSGSVGMYLIHRTNVTGTVVDQAIAQSDWNRDTLDGTGNGDNPSGMNLDPAGINTYFVDFEHEASARIRWGIIYRGERLIIHEMYMNNNPATNFHNSFGSPALPICWAVINEGSPAGNSSLYAYGASVYNGGNDVDPLEEANVRRYDNIKTFTSMSDSTQYLFSLSPLSLYATGQENHSIYKPEILDVAAYDSSDVKVPVEFRLFQKCIIRGTNFLSNNYTTVTTDTQGDHVAHGPEITRFVVDGPTKYDFTSILTTLQNGAVKNNSEYGLAKGSQDLLSITTGSWSTGSVGNQEVARFKVGEHGVYGVAGPNQHWFDDLTSVEVRGTSTVFDNNSYFLAIEDRDDATLYNSTADIDDDRTPRIVTVSTTGSAVVGDYLFITPNMTSSITAIGTSTFTVEGRTTGSLDIGLTSGNWTSDSDGTGGTVTSVTSQSAAYPKDYETKLLAVTASAGNTFSGAGGTFYGSPPHRAQWVFMVRPLTDKTNYGKTITVRTSMTWKELNQ